MGGNQALEMKKRERERSAFPIRVCLARLTGRGWCAPGRGTGVKARCGDKRRERWGERHVPNDLWRELLPGSVG